MAVNHGGNRAAIFDMDGTLVEDVPYNADPKMVKLMPYCVDGLRLLRQSGYTILVASNKSGVSRGLYTEVDVLIVSLRLNQLLEGAGVRLGGFFYCPHHPEGSVPGYAIECDCRKPRPGLLLRAAAMHRLDLGSCWMVGDILDDIEAGKSAGCRTVLLDNGNETEWVMNDRRRPDYGVSTVNDAARTILGM